MMPRISRYATVESDSLAEDVVVGAFSYIGPDVVIGPGCVIDSNVAITGRTTLGEDNRVFPMASIGVPDETDGEGACVIGKANRIREHVTIFAGAEGVTRIANDCLLMVGSRIGKSAKIGSHVVFANCTNVGDWAVLEDYVRGSAFIAINDGVRVGAYSFMNGYAIIDRDAPPFAMLEGDPYRVRGVNTHNLQRCGFEGDDIRALKQAYREVFNAQSREPNRDVVERMLEDENLNPLVRRAIGAIGGEGGNE